MNMKKYKGCMKNEYSPYKIHSTNKTIFYVIILYERLKKYKNVRGKLWIYSKY